MLAATFPVGCRVRSVRATGGAGEVIGHWRGYVRVRWDAFGTDNCERPQDLIRPVM